MLSAEASDGRMYPRRRLTHHNGAHIRFSSQFNELAVAVHQAGRRIEQIEQRRLVRPKSKGRQHAQRRLLIAAPQARS